MSGTSTASRTPETDRIFDCLNDANSEAKLANDIALNALKQKRAAYDAALQAKIDAGGDLETRRKEVASKTADLDFLKISLENARKRTSVLELRFQTENQKALACSADGNTCTIAEKEIHVLTSNSAAEAVQENIREINQYIEDIAAAEGTVENLEGLLVNIEAGAAPKIAEAEQQELAAQAEYVDAKERQDRTQKDYDELHDACKIAQFHKNQADLDEVRSELFKYGVRIELTESVMDPKDVVVEGDPGPDVPDQPSFSNYDCRYKQVSPCQGYNLLISTESQKELCRQQITPECFSEIYQTYWVLDFLSFLFFAFAVPSCVFEEDFSYGLCVGSSAYVLSLKYLQNELGIRY